MLMARWLKGVGRGSQLKGWCCRGCAQRCRQLSKPGKNASIEGLLVRGSSPVWHTAIAVVGHGHISRGHTEGCSSHLVVGLSANMPDLADGGDDGARRAQHREGDEQPSGHIGDSGQTKNEGIGEKGHLRLPVAAKGR